MSKSVLNDLENSPGIHMQEIGRLKKEIHNDAQPLGEPADADYFKRRKELLRGTSIIETAVGGDGIIREDIA